MPYETIDKVGEILKLFPTELQNDTLKTRIRQILSKRPRWIKDCDCDERGIYCDCQQLSER